MRTKTRPSQAESFFPVERKARARRTSPVTSFWAAQGVDVNHRMGMVLTAFIHGPATQHELIDRVRDIYGPDIPESTIRTGCSELEEDGLVEVVAMGKSPSGMPARIYARVVS